LTAIVLRNDDPETAHQENKETIFWSKWWLCGETRIVVKSFLTFQIPLKPNNRATLLPFTALKKLREEEKWQFALF
jgi:hypothetical protein